MEVVGKKIQQEAYLSYEIEEWAQKSIIMKQLGFVCRVQVGYLH